MENYGCTNFGEVRDLKLIIELYWILDSFKTRKIKNDVKYTGGGGIILRVSNFNLFAFLRHMH